MSGLESVGAKEAAARKRGLDRIVKMIQRPDQLEKVKGLHFAKLHSFHASIYKLKLQLNLYLPLTVPGP